MYDHTAPTSTLALSAGWMALSTGETAAQAHVARLHEDAAHARLVRAARRARPARSVSDGAASLRGLPVPFARATSAAPHAASHAVLSLPKALPRALAKLTRHPAPVRSSRSIDLGSDACATC